MAFFDECTKIQQSFGLISYAKMNLEFRLHFIFINYCYSQREIISFIYIFLSPEGNDKGIGKVSMGRQTYLLGFIQEEVIGQGSLESGVPARPLLPQPVELVKQAL